MKLKPSARTGTLCAAATSGSSEAKSNGRAMMTRTRTANPLTSAMLCVCSVEIPRMFPNNTVTPEKPVPVPLICAVNKLRKSTPSPRTQASTVPIATSRPRSRSPNPPIAKATTVVVTSRLASGLMPNAAPPSAPVKATSDSDSPAKAWWRSTTK